MDDYITCEECGHPVERHTSEGCDQHANGCTCTEGWTVKEIEKARREAGLTGKFESWKF